MEPITLFAISGAGAFGMVGLRMLEIRYERCIGLAHVSLRIDRKIRPHAKRLSRALTERKESLAARMRAVPTQLKEVAVQRFERANAALSERTDFLTSSIRGKKMLSGGSVSFFLLNISDYRKRHSAKADDVRKIENAVAIPLIALEDGFTGEDGEGARGKEEEVVEAAETR